MPPPDTDAPLGRLLSGFIDPDWYRMRYPDIGELDPYQHFVRYGAAEKRDPNRFFDSAWYIEHYPDVAASGLDPLEHYARAGAAELRNPHPRFDAVYYAERHPDAAVNPLLYHLRVGLARGYETEKTIEIADYLPSEKIASAPPRGVFADVVVLVQHSPQDARRCIRSVLADQAFPLGRIIVVLDHAPAAESDAWLQELAAEGRISLIRGCDHAGFNALARLGIDAAEEHDVVLLKGDTKVPAGWLGRLIAHAYAHLNIATVSPFRGEAAQRTDEICRIVNTGRSADIPAPAEHCVYIRRAALLAAGGFGSDFHPRATAAGWRHLLACDTFITGSSATGQGQYDAIPFRFALIAALFRNSTLPVILMITHNLGGGVRRHIDALVERYRDTARFLLLEGTDRGAALSVPSLSDRPVLTLPADRRNDLVAVLRSTNLSRIHIHHLLQMDVDVRALIHRLGVPFDVTVHDYYAICPQVNLLRWDEGLYCGEPGPAACNACIADRSSHGARDIVSWRRDWAWQFIEADRVICPSNDVKRRLDRHGVGERAFVVPHEQQTEPFWTSRRPEPSGRLLRIALLGVLANHKGAHAVAEVAEAAAPGTIELHLIGDLERSFPQPARKLIIATGRYQDHVLPTLLQRIDPDVFWFPSSAPETYSYTLSTAIATGLPIVATDLGSFTERLAGRPLSWLVDHRASAKDWLAVFDVVRATLGDRAAQPTAPRTLETSDFYRDHYLSPPPRKASTSARRKPLIAVVPERYSSGGLTPCAYIRLLQPLDHPAIGSGLNIVLTDAATVFDYAADIIVTQRCAIPDIATANRLAGHAHRTGAKLLFDLDDDLLNVPGSHPDAAVLRPFAKLVRRMLTVSDAVWVSTKTLAERLAPIRPDATLIENRLDERIWISGSDPHTPWDDPVRILCMGTSTHHQDFAMIEPALVQLKAEYGDRVVIDVLGMTSARELPAGLNRIGPPTHASRSYPGFVNWLTSVQPRWHIGLAPLLDTPFNRSKSAVKAMDYAALGLTVLASDTPVYRGSIADGPAGQLVPNTPQSWNATLDWLIRNHDLRRSGLLRARRAFLSHATLAGQAEPRLAALTQLLKDRTDGNDARLQDAAAMTKISNDETDPVTRKRRPGGRGR